MSIPPSSGWHTIFNTSPLSTAVSDVDLRVLQRATRQRKRQAFRPGTHANHKRQMSLFLSFCLHYDLQYINPASETLCMYAEFLARSFTSPRAIRNYISGIRLLHKYISVKCEALHSFQLDLVLRGIELSTRHIPNRKLPMTREILTSLVSLCDHLHRTGLAIKVALLFGYFGFLRQSNLAPKTIASFDPSRHTCRGDVLFQPPGLVILLKWSKTIQRGEKVHLIPLPAIPGSPLCPHAAYVSMLRAFPTMSQHDPLLQIRRPGSRRISPLTSEALSRAFKSLMECLGHNPHDYSLHSLRAGGATAAYHAGVDTERIKRHGTWRSDCFWSYVASDPVEQSHVAAALAAPR